MRLLGLEQHLLERFLIAVLGENAIAHHGPLEDMVYVTAAGKPQTSWHAANLPPSSPPVNIKDSRPLFHPPRIWQNGQVAGIGNGCLMVVGPNGRSILSRFADRKQCPGSC